MACIFKPITTGQFKLYLYSTAISSGEWTAVPTELPTDIRTTQFDFTRISNVAATFDVNEVKKTISLDLKIIDDDIPEEQEMILIYIEQHDGINEPGAFAIVKIIDDDVTGIICHACLDVHS